MNNLFVYGTLKSGYGNNAYLQGQKLLGKAETRSPKIMVTEGIPFVYNYSHCYIAGGAGDRALVQGEPIIGELWQVDDEALARIDRLEGHPRWYQREQERVLLHLETERIQRWSTMAWIYYMPARQLHEGVPIFGGAQKITNVFQRIR